MAKRLRGDRRPARRDEWFEILDQLFAGSWNPDLGRFRSPFAFRGMAHAGDALSTTLSRLAAGRDDVTRLETHLLRNFRKYAHAEAKGTGTDTIWTWLALAQHHGLPTRLLDWTYSPFVALHFATANLHAASEDGVVWCVNFVEANKGLPRRLRQMLRREGSDTFTVEMLSGVPSLSALGALSRRPFVLFIEPPSLDARILNQFALFSMMSSPMATLDEWIGRHPAIARRVVIPASVKWEIRDKLDQANINERTLFPGLDGLSQWLARYYMPKSRRQ